MVRASADPIHLYGEKPHPDESSFKTPSSILVKLVGWKNFIRVD